MQHNYAFPIGSNTKLFTAVALWQLHRQGKVNMFDPVTEYLDPADFGLKERWCPRLSNVTSGRFGMRFLSEVIILTTPAVVLLRSSMHFRGHFLMCFYAYVLIIHHSNVCLVVTRLCGIDY